MMINHIISVISLLSAILLLAGASDETAKPCKARPILGQSVICVCDSDYCDEIIREKPKPNHYVAYATSKSGLRFYKTKGLLQEAYEGTFPATTLQLNVSKQYQTIEGFGGTITDAAGINWKSLEDPKLQQYFIDSYFSPTGLGYNVVRTPIGGSDCSNRKYALNELPKYDKKLTNYSLAFEDYEYKIPMFKAAMNASQTPINVLASTWSPPDWMKVSNGISVCGKLNPDYYQTYADYHIKFMEEYKKQGIDIWGVTTTNEPTNAFVSSMVFNCMAWSSSDQAKWIVENLGPSIRASDFNETLIFTNDDQRYAIPFLFNELVSSNPEVLKYINGVAVHGYADNIIPPTILDAVTKCYPQLKLMVTEICAGYLPNDLPKVDLGSWERAEAYMSSLFGNLNYGAVGFIDWNLCLDKIGGPNWALNFIDSSIIVFPESGEFVKQPTFYVMGHFAKFIPRGSKKIHVDVSKTAYDSQLQNVAFLTPENTVVVILYNPSDETRVSIVLGSQTAIMMVPAESIVTLEMLVDATSYEPTTINSGPGDYTSVNEKAAISDTSTSAIDPEERTSSPRSTSNNQQPKTTPQPAKKPANVTKNRGQTRRPGQPRQNSPQKRRPQSYSQASAYTKQN